MKKILLACSQSFIDTPLRRSLAHLAKSCKTTIVRDGFSAFDEIKAQAFDLVIIDSQLPDIDSLEAVESVRYIDPGAPVILILQQTYQGVWDTVRHLGVHPITRPFKPLRFLRLVDKLLHRHLNHYRQLAERLKTMLETLRSQTGAPCVFLVEDSGQILASSGEMMDIPIESLGNLAVNSMALDGEIRELSRPRESLPTRSQLEQDYGLYVTFVAANLHLALISSGVANGVANLQGAPETWQQIDMAANQTRTALYDQIRSDISPPGNGKNTPSHVFIPLKLDSDSDLSGAKNEEEKIAAPWEIISNTSNLLSRLDDFCHIN